MQIRLSLTEKKMHIQDDPRFQEKTDIIEQMTEILKNRKISSSKRNYSILEDALMLCILFNWHLRDKRQNIYEKKFYQRIQETFQIQRSFEAFKRRFQHLKMFDWTVDILEKLLQIISQDIPLDNQIIKYDTSRKTIELPNSKQSSNTNSQFELETENDNQLKQQFHEPIDPIQSKQLNLAKQISKIISYDLEQIQLDMNNFTTQSKFILFLLKAFN